GYFAAFGLNGSAASIVELGQRHLRYSHERSQPIGEHRLPEDLYAVARVDAIQLLRQRAHQYRPPKPADGRSGLLATPQPFQHGTPALLAEVWRVAAAEQDVRKRTSNTELVPQRQGSKGQKRTGHVQGCRQ